VIIFDRESFLNVVWLKNKTLNGYLCCLVLLVITAWVGFAVDRYRPVSGQLLVDADLRKSASWEEISPARISHRQGMVVLRDNGKHFVHMEQIVEKPEGAVLLRLQADLATADVVAGSHPWQQARLVLQGLNGKGKGVPGPHQVAHLQGDNDWHAYAKVFTFAASTKRMRVVIQLPKVPGEFRVRDPLLQVVEPIPALRVLVFLLFSLWGLFLLAVLRRYASFITSSGGRFAVVVFLAIILFGTLSTAQFRVSIVQQVAGFINQVSASFESEEPPASLEVGVKKSIPPPADFVQSGLNRSGKAGHAIFFACLVLSMGLAAGGAVLATVTLDAVFLGVITEALQSFVPARSPLFQDILIDILGISAGICLVLLYTVLRRFWCRLLQRS